MVKINKKEIKLISVDIDGTIIPHGKKKLSQKLINTINYCLDQQIYFVLNTGNIHSYVKWILDEIRIPYSKYMSYFIGSSGIELHNFNNNKTIINGSFNNEQVKKVIKILNDYDIHFTITDPDLKVFYFSHKNDLDEVISLGKNEKENLQLWNNEKMNTMTSPKIAFKTYDDSLLFDLILNKISDAIGENNFSYSSWIKNGADLIASGHNKYTGLVSMLKIINNENNESITLDNVLYFGDNSNDLPVFEKLKNTIAVENAIDEVKKLALDITDSAENDGVAKYIELLLK